MESSHLVAWIRHQGSMAILPKYIPALRTATMPAMAAPKAAAADQVLFIQLAFFQNLKD